RVAAEAARGLAEMPAPAWVFFHTRLDPRSASDIRRQKRPARARKPAPEGAANDALPARRRRKAAPAPAEPGLLDRIVASLEDGKAENIVTIDLAGKTSIAD